LPKPNDDDFAEWSNLISQIAEGVEALNAEAKRLPSRVTGRNAASYGGDIDLDENMIDS
jgi:hypothetical protein